MKTILVPTDFSSAANNALEYAVELAKKFQSKLILINAYHVPVVASEVPMPLPSLTDMEHDIKVQLAKTQNDIHLKHGYELKIESHCVCGFAADEIQNFVEHHPVDLIVMGMRGAGIIEEKLIGSITTSVIARVKTPVLIIDPTKKFKRPGKIVLATDYEPTESKSFDLMKFFATSFNSHVFILNVMEKAFEAPTLKEAAGGVNLDHYMGGTDHSFHYLENSDVIDGINRFNKKHDADMLVMIARKHSFLHNLLHGSTTKKMAFHSQLPILALHN